MKSLKHYYVDCLKLNFKYRYHKPDYILCQDGFKRVDHDYVLKTAELAKAGGLGHMQLMSSMGADHKGSALYTKTKGQVEEAMKVMHFQKLSIFRPG